MSHLSTLLSVVFLILFGSIDSLYAHAGKDALSGNIVFTENAGQITDTEGKVRRDIQFITIADNMALYFSPRSVSYVFRQELQPANAHLSPANERKPSGDELLYRMDMELLGANPDVALRSYDQANTLNNYYYPHCSDGIHGVRSWQRLVYTNIYSNIDLVFYSNGTKLKYDFIVHPGGRVEDIRLRYSGAEQLATTGDTLVVGTPLGSLVEGRLVTYQGGGHIESRYRITSGTVSFYVGEYDHSRELVIDPEVDWATYLGSSGDDGLGFGLAVDHYGDIVVSGETGSTSFPVTVGVVQTVHGGQVDAFVAKFSNAGELIWSTFYGGSGAEGEEKNGDLAVSGENYVVTGTTFSADFPVSSGAAQAVYGGGGDGFILTLTKEGKRMWATYYGGSGKDEIMAVAVDSTGAVAFTGRTNSRDYPVSAGAFQMLYGGAASNAFLTKLTGYGTMLWSTYYGGSGALYDYGFDVACAGTGEIILTGHAGSNDFPVTDNAFQQIHRGGLYDMFVVKFDVAGRIRWGTLYGGSGSDEGNGIAVDADGNVYMTGPTRSADFPVSDNAWQKQLAGSEYNNGIVKFGNDGTMVWSTYYGGTAGGLDGDGSYRIELSKNGRMAIVGTTTSLDFPVTPDALQKQYGGGRYDGFILLMDTSGVPVWSSYYGGNQTDYTMGAAFDPSSNLVVSGYTRSQNLYTTGNGYQKTYGGGTHDGFIVKFGVCSFSGLAIVVKSDAVEVDSGAVDLLRCRRITIRNNSGSEQQLTKGWFENNTYFSFPQGQLPLVIPPGEETDAMVCFVPDSIGEFRDTLMLSNDCGSLRTAVYSVVGSPVGSVYSVESGCGIPVRLQVRDWKKSSALPFPQPASDVVYVPVDVDAAGGVRSTLVTLTGIPVAEGVWFPDAQVVEFDVANIRAGVYGVCIQGALWQKYYTIIVE